MDPTLRVQLCLLLGRLFSKGPLASYGTHTDKQTTSIDTCISDRVSTVPEYYKLFTEFCSLKGKTVMELGCSRGYLLASLLEIETFRAIGVDKDPIALADGAVRYGNRIEFVESTVTRIPVPDSECDIVYTVDVV